MFNVEEAAEYMKVSKATIYKRLNSGEIEFLEIGTRKIIPRKVIDEYIEQNLTQKEQPFKNDIKQIGG